MLFAAMIGICFLIGIMTGVTGVGGILIPPLLVFMSGLETHVAMGTSLAVMIFLTGLGTWMFLRLGHIDWGRAVFMCFGGLAGWPGAKLATYLDANPLIIILSLVIIVAGVCSFRPPAAREKAGSFWHSPLGLMTIGAPVALLAGLTGVGGGVLAIPWLIIVGYAPLAALGLSMPYQLVTALSGSVFNVLGGYVDYTLLPVVAAAMLVGFYRGVHIAQRVPAASLRKAISIICCLLGVFLLVRQVLFPFTVGM